MEFHIKTSKYYLPSKWRLNTRTAGTALLIDGYTTKKKLKENHFAPDYVLCFSIPPSQFTHLFDHTFVLCTFCSTITRFHYTMYIFCEFCTFNGRLNWTNLTEFWLFVIFVFSSFRHTTTGPFGVFGINVTYWREIERWNESDNVC